MIFYDHLEFLNLRCMRSLITRKVRIAWSRFDVRAVRLLPVVMMTEERDFGICLNLHGSNLIFMCLISVRKADTISF